MIKSVYKNKWKFTRSIQWALNEKALAEATRTDGIFPLVKGTRELAVLDNFVSHFRIIPITSEIAKAGGLYKRDFGKSHGVGLADAILAATAQKEQAELKTLNIKHYPMINGLKPAYKNPK